MIRPGIGSSARPTWQERQALERIQKAYEECLGATSSKAAPWYVVPADDKENARLIISKVLLETLGGLKMSYPGNEPDRAARKLQAIRKQLLK